MNSYADIHTGHAGKVSDKWASYFPIYDRLFREIRQAPIRLLEIGVHNGGSLEILAKYFPNAAQIVGCDIDPLCGTLHYDDPRISVVVGDINSRAVFDRIVGEVAPIDVLLDDGSHKSSDIVSSFLFYFPSLAPGGLYVIEDTHTLYAEAWGGGIRNPRSALHLFKLLTDVVNYEHWQKDVALAAYLSGFFPQNAVPAFIVEGWIESVEFQNSIVVIRKAKQGGHAKLGTRVLTGTESKVATFIVDGAPFAGAKPSGG